MKIKLLFIALGAIILVGVGAWEFKANKTSLISEFDKPIVMNVAENISFSDGLNISVKEINDSRCKPNVQCIWAGELAATLIVSGGAFQPTAEIRLGTINNQEVSMNGYTFTLVSATETSVTINVKKDIENRIAGGYVSGHVTIGPLCPVEQVGVPCANDVQSEMYTVYTSRQAVIYYDDGVRVREQSALDKKGNYKIALGPGNYFAQIQPAGIGPGEKKPFTVVSFETTTVDFDIDTGMR